MACKVYQDLIDKYIEGLVTLEEKNILERHIKVCPECRQEMKDLKQIIKAANSLEPVELPLDFMPNLLARIEKIPLEQKPSSKSSGFIGFIKNIPSLLTNFYYHNKRAFIAVAGIFLIGIFTVTLYKTGNLNMNFAMKSARNEMTREIAPAEEPEMTDGAEMFSAQSRGMPDSAMEYDEVSNDVAANMGGRALKTESSEMTQKIIKNVDMSIYVENFDKKVDKVINLVNDLGGYIENSEIQGAESADSSRRAYMALRVPQAELTKVLDEFKAMGRVRNQHIGGENITEAYYDTSARVNNLRQQEERLLEILKIAKNVDEVLRIENELNRVRTDIELMTGQLSAWDKMVEMSLVNLHLIEQEPSKEKLSSITLEELARRGKQGFIAAWNLSLNLLASLVELLGALLPVAVIVFLFIKLVQVVIKIWANRKR